MAMASVSPITAPISVKLGRRGSDATCEAGARTGSIRGPMAVTGAGRREGEKMGRSRVAGKVESGIGQSGFPLGSSTALGSGFGTEGGVRVSISFGGESKVVDVTA
jgi:hypothetical protein